MQYLTFEQRVSAMRLEFLSQAFGLAGAAFARISFAVLLLKFCVASRAWCWTVWSIIWVQAVCNSATVLIIYLQCRPIQALWNPNVEGTCWSPQIQVIAGYALGGEIRMPSRLWNTDWPWDFSDQCCEWYSIATIASIHHQESDSAIASQSCPQYGDVYKCLVSSSSKLVSTCW